MNTPTAMQTSCAQHPEACAKINGAQLTIRLLEQQGITYIAGIPGGANLPLYDALVDSEITHILTRHEQAAGFLAQGLARASGQVQVCFASSGPGATNFITAVADAKLDSIPIIAITGQVSQNMIGTDAFQEVDTFGLMLPITKHNYLVRSAEELLTVVPEAFHIARSGRPGPVSIDIPKDVQQQIVSTTRIESSPTNTAITTPDSKQIETFLRLLKASKRPLLMIGGGAVQSNCSRELLKLIELQQIPVVCSFMGLGVIASDHPLNLGMLGMHGSRATHHAIDECDLLIAAGVRFDDRATGKVSEFCPQADIVHIDIDASEINKIKSTKLAINADLRTTVNRLLDELETGQRQQWRQRIEFLKQRFCLPAPCQQETLHPYNLLPEIDTFTKRQAIVVTDVGQHQMWTAQAFPFSRPRQWISSGGLGTMGFGLPAAIGAALAEPDRPIICITGDGSLLMNIQELDTLAELQLNVKIVVFNNQNLGLVRQQQSLFYNGRHKALGNRRRLQFAAVARSMGIEGVDLSNSSTPLDDIEKRVNAPGPYLIDIPIDENAKVFPMVPPGAANRDTIF